MISPASIGSGGYLPFSVLGVMSDGYLFIQDMPEPDVPDVLDVDGDPDPSKKVKKKTVQREIPSAPNTLVAGFVNAKTYTPERKSFEVSLESVSALTKEFKGFVQPKEESVERQREIAAITARVAAKAEKAKALQASANAVFAAKQAEEYEMMLQDFEFLALYY